ncbi:MAG: hypothetical protein NVV62_07870 [Terricaulis sp.]|nr:hypothetical protein [Terricaulis sp.]
MPVLDVGGRLRPFALSSGATLRYDDATGALLLETNELEPAPPAPAFAPPPDAPPAPPSAHTEPPRAEAAPPAPPPPAPASPPPQAPAAQAAPAPAPSLQSPPAPPSPPRSPSAAAHDRGANAARHCASAACGAAAARVA